MATNTQTFSDLVRTQVAAIQGAAAGVVNFTVGSIELALVEAQAQVGLWLHGFIPSRLAFFPLPAALGKQGYSDISLDPRVVAWCWVAVAIALPANAEAQPADDLPFGSDSCRVFIVFTDG